MSVYEVVPVPEENYNGRQRGWEVRADGEPVAHARQAVRGDCWNIDLLGDGEFHVCELGDLIRALEALRDSEAHRLNVERRA